MTLLHAAHDVHESTSPASRGGQMVEPAFGTGLAGPPIPGSSSPPGVAIWKLGPRLGLGRGPPSCLHNDPYTLYIGLCEQRGSLVRTSPVVADGPERIGRLTGPAPTASATRRNCLARACSITHAHDRLRHPEGPYPSAPASPLRTGPAWPCTTYPLVRHPARARRRARRRARCRSPRPDRTGRSLNAPTGAWCSLTRPPPHRRGGRPVSMHLQVRGAP